jgi:hypothetical protein
MSAIAISKDRAVYRNETSILALRYCRQGCFGYLRRRRGSA